MPERLNGLVSKTSAGFALAGGSNPSLSATPTSPSQTSSSGEVSEWLKEHAWKACVSVPGTEGSNPSLSAIPGAIYASTLGRIQDLGVGSVLATDQGRTGSGRERSSPKITDPCVSDRALSHALDPPLLLFAVMRLG